MQSLFVYIISGLFCASLIVDMILWDFIAKGTGNEDASKFNVATIPFLAASLRMAISVPLVSWKDIKPLCLFDFTQLFLCRFFFNLGWHAGFLVVPYIGAGAHSVFVQSQTLLTGVFRYLIFGDIMTTQEIIHALSIFLLAIAFSIEDIDKFEGKQNESTFFLAYILVIIRAVLGSFMFAMNEKVLKNTLSHAKCWEKQFFFALCDVPILLAFAFGNAAWDTHLLKQGYRSYNIFEHLDSFFWIQSANQTVMTICVFEIFDWADAMLANICYAVAMSWIWPLEVIIGFEKFSRTKLMILLILFLACIGFREELKAKAKQTISEKTATLELP